MPAAAVCAIMPDISVTEDQYDRLDAVRGDIEEAYVGEYGHARLEDAVQYLLDTYTPPGERAGVEAYDRIATAEYPTLQRVASDVDGVPGSGIDADEMRGRLLSELGADALAAELADATADGEDAPAGTATEETDTQETTADEGTTETERTTEPEDAQEAADPAPGGGSILASANKLLRDHDDKWRESDGEARYEVDRPDGGTEPARTKDDVRQLLFRHY